MKNKKNVIIGIVLVCVIVTSTAYFLLHGGPSTGQDLKSYLFLDNNEFTSIQNPELESLIADDTEHDAQLIRNNVAKAQYALTACPKLKTLTSANTDADADRIFMECIKNSSGEVQRKLLISKNLIYFLAYPEASNPSVLLKTGIGATTIKIISVLSCLMRPVDCVIGLIIRWLMTFRLFDGCSRYPQGECPNRS